MTRPIIGITTNLGAKGAELARGYWQSVRRAGGTPLLLPPTADAEELLSQVEQLDGLLLSGGGDINPLLCGEEPLPGLGGICPERDGYELALIREALRRGIPTLGICRGMQLLAIAAGGRVAQDMAAWHGANAASAPETYAAPLVKHSQDAPRDCATHHVSIAAGSILRGIVGECRLAVNSFHHQAVIDPGRLRVVARAADGFAEAVESPLPVGYALGVQWHPECMADDASRRLFDAFVGHASCYCHAVELHGSLTTLDSHCDTPMTYDAAIAAAGGDERKALDYSHKDPRHYKVDAGRMDIGRLDEAYMVCYVPQGPRTAEGYAAARRMVEDTYRRMDIMEEVTPGLRGRVRRGIENGYALGLDPAMVAHYRAMGCEYITLCHNGHNDICDSARPKAGEPQEEHGGLSAYGRRIVEEMNRQRVLIDVSHASEKTVMDVLECSTRPIAVTHTCCRALRNHPRNLADGVLRAVAERGGVVQCTMYEGFCALDHPEDYGIPQSLNPSILTFMVHLRHLIDVCGVDHVGIGSDFDGDGGVPGLDDVASMLKVTQLLLRDGFSDDDICRIWGDNFRRVLHGE